MPIERETSNPPSLTMGSLRLHSRKTLNVSQLLNIAEASTASLGDHMDIEAQDFNARRRKAEPPDTDEYSNEELGKYAPTVPNTNCDEALNGITVFKNRILTYATTKGRAKTVCEPSAAKVGDSILVTGNHFVAFTFDGGKQWKYINPDLIMPTTDGGFCCDQTVLYAPTGKFWIFLQQYRVGTSSKSNTLRMSIIRSENLHEGHMFAWDLKPGEFREDWSDEWFDYNHAALSNNYLYLGTNVFSVSNDKWTRSVIMKISIEDLKGKDVVFIEFVNTTFDGSLRCTLGAKDTMHILARNKRSRIRVYSWPETLGNDKKISGQDIEVRPWQEGDYSAIGPDGKNWLCRCDGRITGAWVSKGVIGCMWTANGTNESTPYPHVRVARIDETTKKLIDEPDIWNLNYAYAYPDACPNSHGELGVTMFCGGGDRHPSHVVGVWDDATKGWRLTVTRRGKLGPPGGKWGDYLSCRPHFTR